MAPYYPWWGPMCVFPTIMPIIMLVVLIMVLCLVFGRRGFCSPWHGPTRLDDQGQSPESGLEILKKRYAKAKSPKKNFNKCKRIFSIRGALMETGPTRLGQKRIE